MGTRRSASSENLKNHCRRILTASCQKIKVIETREVWSKIKILFAPTPLSSALLPVRPIDTRSLSYRTLSAERRVTGRTS
jgi:hypothetical protein